MQRLLVIFALGTGLLLAGCAVQDLPFSGSTADQTEEAPTPYTPPQPGSAHDGSNEGASEAYQPIPAHQVPMPAGTASQIPATSPAQGTPQNGVNTPSGNSNGANGAAAPKPVTRSASGLQEREL